MAYLIEETMGNFPTWLAPVQVKVLPISDKYMDYAEKVNAALQEAGIRVELDRRGEKIGYKIREAQSLKIPYMLIVGQKEEEDGTVAVRSRSEGDLGAQPLADFLAKVQEEIRTKAH